MESLSEAVLSAEGEVDPFLYMRKMKSAVIESIAELDSSAEIEDTHYFNHSAVPDLLLRWRDGRGERPIYLRRSILEVEAAQDVRRLAITRPVFLSINSQANTGDQDWDTRLGIDEAGNEDVLVTDATAIDALREDGTSDSPLRGAIAANILPAGHGFLNQGRALDVVTPSADSMDRIAELLSASAFASVSRVASIVSAAESGEVDGLDIVALSPQEARDLLPWLLRNESVTSSEVFWKTIAESVGLKTIEQLHAELAELDLSPLCRWGVSGWTSSRASLGVNPMLEDESRRDGWFMDGRNLTLGVQEAAFRFSTYGQSIREHNSVSSATWQRLKPQLPESASLSAITLRGIARRIRLSAEESSNVMDDVDLVEDSLEDRYYVDEVSIRLGLATEDRRVRVLLGDQIAFNEGSASVVDMLNALASIAAYRDPVDASAYVSQRTEE